jgi:hypothetical protein
MILSDADRIRNLLGRYCRLVDAGDFAGVGELMGRARFCDEDGKVIATGREEIATFLHGIVRIHGDGTPRTQHLVLNTIFDEGTGDDRAVARSAYVVLQAAGEQPLRPIVTGSYVDTFGRDDDGTWHFTERRFGVGLSGDLSRHLPPGLLES